jgi:hypothetical protein
MAAREIMNLSIAGADRLDYDRQRAKLRGPGPPLARFAGRGKALS